MFSNVSFSICTLASISFVLILSSILNLSCLSCCSFEVLHLTIVV